MSNMRQLSLAMISWAGEHNQYMVGRGGSNILYFDPYTHSFNSVPGTDPKMKTAADWIAWQRKLDPITGVTISGAADQNITYSALAPYLNVKSRDHATPAEANSIAAQTDDLYRCPSDNLAQRNKWTDQTKPRYSYSYSINDLFTNPIQPPDTTDYPNIPANLPRNQRFGFTFSGKIGSIRASSERILLVCQDEQTLDDGLFKPNAAKWVSNNAGDQVSSRHELKFKKAKSTSADTGTNQNARGNVGFCDGHVEFMTRKEALSQRYSGHPLPDPPGF
jgi:prepilin-type processing-associated H-X9-DG protein